jgi:hypothetical protein
MKKRRVMRLLAVVMAVSLAATSVPGTALTGTETVYADETMTGDPVIKVGGEAVSSGNQDKLVADAVLTVDTTEITNPTGEFSYQWKSDGSNVGTDSPSYTLTADDEGKVISVEVSYSGYTAKTATTTTKVKKTYTVSNVTTDGRNIKATVTAGTTGADYEYSLDGGTTAPWTTASSGSVSGTTLTIEVNDSTVYAADKIQVRAKQTETGAQGAAVTSDKPLAVALAGSVTLAVTRSGEDVKDNTLQVGDVITATVTGAQQGVTLNYTFKNSNDETVVQAASTKNTYTVQDSDKGYTISVEVTAADSDSYSGSISSSATATAKAEASALSESDVKPAAPTAIVSEDGTDKYTYTMKITDGTVLYQCKEDNTDADSWDANTMTTSTFQCDPNKTYTFYAVRKADESHLQGTQVVSWTVTFPKLKHKALALSYKVTGDDTKTVTIDEVAGAQYKFDEDAYGDTKSKEYTNAKTNNTTAIIKIKYKDSEVFEEDTTELTASIDLTKTQETAPTSVTAKFAPNAGKKYSLTITPTYEGSGTLEYSTDGQTFTTKAELEAESYEPGTSLVVYARAAATEAAGESSGTLASQSVKSAAVTAPAAPATPTITIDAGKVTISVSDGSTIYYTVNGSEPTKADGKTYSETFTVTDGTTVKAVAYKDDDTVLSATASKTYTASKANEEPKKEESDKNSGDKDNAGTTGDTTLTIQKDADGSKTVVDDKGNVVADSKVTIDGKSYITDKNGVIETGKVTKTPSGNKVYVDKDGAIVKNKTVSYKGKKYYATKTGKIATNGFVKTAKGNTVYATKSGVLKVNKAFKASNGKKYVADKNGKIVKGKKITIGNKTYTTNKKGVIIKVTTKKK